VGLVKPIGRRRHAVLTSRRLYFSKTAVREHTLALLDDAHRQRIKIWGTAKVVESDTSLIARLMPAGYAAKAEHVTVFTVTVWDANCPQHIPARFEADAVKAALEQRDQLIQEL
jgi:uncharacterized protein